MSKQRAKGTSKETAVVNYLRENGFPQAERHLLNNPTGDVKNLPVVMEVKNHHSSEALSSWCNQALKEGELASKPWVVAHHRMRRSTNETYCTTSLEIFSVMMLAYEYCLDNNIQLNV